MLQLTIYENDKEFEPMLEVTSSYREYLKANGKYNTQTKRYQISKEKLEGFLSQVTNSILEVEYKSLDGKINQKVEEKIPKLKIETNYIRFEFPYNEKILEIVRALTGRQYNSTEKYWKIPLEQLNKFKTMLDNSNIIYTIV